MPASMHVYQTDDADAGAYTYFAFTDDTIAGTQHIEFRYGETLENIGSYSDGDYAYWLSAGIVDGYKESLIQDCIKLFVDENAGEAEEAEAASADEALAEEATSADKALADEATAADEAPADEAAAADEAPADEAAAADEAPADEAAAADEAPADEAAAAEEIPAASETIEISDAQGLASINDNLDGNYVLTADIDLAGAEWTPLGSFVQMSEEGEGAETPNPDYAFTGTFDGQGHTISNFVINQPEGYCLGLFGCIADAQVGNFRLENVTADGTSMVAAAVGYANCSQVEEIEVDGAVITAHASEMSAEGMYGSVVAAGMMSRIVDCHAKADIIIPDGTANAGVLGGGLEMTSVVNCSASGTVTAGNDCYGLGGLSGCGFGTEEFTDCSVEQVTITAGDNCFWIGGITGYAGGYQDETAGVPVTAFTGCEVKDATIITGDNQEGVDAIVGAGFFMEGLAEAYGMDVYAAPTEYVITDCNASNVMINEEAAA